MFASAKSMLGRWYLRLVVMVICAIGVITIFMSNQYLTQRFTETISSRSEVRLALYVTNLMSEIQRNSVVPQLWRVTQSLSKRWKTKIIQDRLPGFCHLLMKLERHH